jgi:hypothetical protein
MTTGVIIVTTMMKIMVVTRVDQGGMIYLALFLAGLMADVEERDRMLIVAGDREGSGTRRLDVTELLLPLPPLCLVGEAWNLMSGVLHASCGGTKEPMRVAL